MYAAHCRTSHGIDPHIPGHASRTDRGHVGGVGVDPGVVQIAIGRVEATAGEEEQILPLGVEDRGLVVVEAGGGLAPLP